MANEVKEFSLEEQSEVNSKFAKAMEYLHGLSEEAYNDVLKQIGQFAIVDYDAHEDWTPEDCIECLSLFMDYGIWIGHLFLNGPVWSIYVKSRVEEKYRDAIEYVLTVGVPDDFIMYLNAAARFGTPVLPDQEYDVIEQAYKAAFPGVLSIENFTFEDAVYGSVVNNAIKMSTTRGSKSASPRRAPEGVAASLNAEKSTSIKPVRSYLEAYEFIKNAPGVPTHWSLKVDGFNTKGLVKEGDLEVALSRGRATDSWDYTEAIRKVFVAKGVTLTGLDGKITGESMVDPNALDYLRAKYPGKDYKTPKSTAGAMLRAPQSFDDSDYKHLKFYPFEIEGTRKNIAFEKFKEAGFDVVPSKMFGAGEIPLDSLESFSKWLDDNIMDFMYEEGQKLGIGSDGVVLQLLTDVESDRADKYSDLNIALKFSHWTEQSYQSIVTNILLEQRRVTMSVVLEIEPVITRDLNRATRVSVGSSAILIKDGVKIGDTIEFTRKSEAINVYERKVSP